MDSSVLKHARIAEIVDSLVAARGGRVTYDTGCGGREILIAAGAHLAAQTGAQLTIVEARVLHSEVRALVHELQPDIRSAVISADEAAQQRAGTTTGVLAVHADVLHNAHVREPLLVMAHSADHLVVARYDYSDTTLDSLAAPGLVLRSHDLLPTATPNPGPRPGAAERRETASQPGTLASGPRALAAARLWTRLSSEERKKRFIRQLNQASEEQKLELDEFVREVLSADPAEVRRRLEQLKEQEQQLTGEGGLLQQLTKRVLESALEGEITDHIGYEKHDPAGKNNGNSRNGTRAKTVLTDVGPVEVKVPCYTAGTFEPQIVKKRQRRLAGVDEMVLSLSAKGLTHGEISAHLAEVYGAEVSKQTISTITDKVMDGMAEWQNRPLDRVHPVLFVDAINVKIRDGQVANRPIYVVMAVTVDGSRDILGIWAGDGGEGAKYWLHVFTELKNRGLDDVLMLVCDGLKGLPEAVETVWPRTIVQTCVVHLLRNSFRYAARQDWRSSFLRPVARRHRSRSGGRRH